MTEDDRDNPFNRYRIAYDGAQCPTAFAVYAAPVASIPLAMHEKLMVEMALEERERCVDAIRETSALGVVEKTIAVASIRAMAAPAAIREGTLIPLAQHEAALAEARRAEREPDAVWTVSAIYGGRRGNGYFDCTDGPLWGPNGDLRRLLAGRDRVRLEVRVVEDGQ